MTAIVRNASVTLSRVCEGATGSTYLLDLPTIENYAIVCIMPVMKRATPKGKRMVFDDKYRTVVDLKLLQGLELKFDASHLSSFKRIIGGFATQTEADKTLRLIGLDTSERRELLETLEELGMLVDKKDRDFPKDSFITTDRLYKIQLYIDSYRDIRVECYERDARGNPWVKEYSRTWRVCPSELEGKTILTLGRVKLTKVMTAVMSHEPTLRFIRNA